MDSEGRPIQNIRIRHTYVLDDPFPDPPGLDALIPEVSPEPVQLPGDRIEEDWRPQEDNRPVEEIEAEVSCAAACHSTAAPTRHPIYQHLPTPSLPVAATQGG